jgi:hypothetical protein
VYDAHKHANSELNRHWIANVIVNHMSCPNDDLYVTQKDNDTYDSNMPMRIFYIFSIVCRQNEVQFQHKQSLN